MTDRPHPDSPATDGQKLAPGEAAARLGVSGRTLRRWEARGLITPLRLPSGHRRYLLTDVERLEQGAAS